MLDVRDRNRDVPTIAWSAAKLLLLAGVVSIALAVWIATRPVDNPGVQDCGPALQFIVGNKPNVVIFPGEPGAPPNAVALAGQPLCRDLAILQMKKAGLAAGAGFALLLIGTVVGLVDDRVALWRAPTFESLLRPVSRDQRAAFALDDAVRLEELGWELPPIEGREVAGFVFASIVVAVGIPLAAGFDRVGDAFGGLGGGTLLLAVVLVVVSFVAAAAQRVSALGLTSWVSTIEATVASTWSGALRPVVGTFGIDAHHLGKCEPQLPYEDIEERVGALELVSLVVHVLAVLLATVAVLGVEVPAVNYDPRFLFVGLLAIVLVLNGLTTVGRRVRGLPVRPNRAAWRGLRDLIRRRGPAVAVLAAATAAVLVAHVGVTVAVVCAFDADLALAPVAFAALAAVTLGAVAGTPSGLVAADAIAFLLLVRFGMGPGQAGAAVVTVRVLTTWIPMVPGARAAARLHAADKF